MLTRQKCCQFLFTSPFCLRVHIQEFLSIRQRLHNCLFKVIKNWQNICQSSVFVDRVGNQHRSTSLLACLFTKLKLVANPMGLHLPVQIITQWSIAYLSSTIRLWREIHRWLLVWLKRFELEPFSPAAFRMTRKVWRSPLALMVNSRLPYARVSLTNSAAPFTYVSVERSSSVGKKSKHNLNG